MKFRGTIWINGEHENYGRNSDPSRKIRDYVCLDEEQFKTIVRREFPEKEITFGPITKKLSYPDNIPNRRKK